MVTLNIDFSQNLRNLPRWQRYTTALRNTRKRTDGLASDSEDTKLLKAIDMKLERAYYVLTDVCPTEYDFWNKTYRWYNPWKDGFFGDDGIIDNIISHGAQPLINLGGIPAFMGNESVGIFPGQESNWETLIYDILMHLKSETKYPGIEYVSLFNEVMDGWKWYNECYKHTSHAVDRVNNSLPSGVSKIKFGGKDDYSLWDGYFPSYNGGVSPREGLLPSFLQYVKDNSLNLDFLTWHIYNNGDSYFGLPIDDINSSAVSAQKMKQWLDDRNMTAELFISEWCNRGDNMNYNLSPFEQCKESTWTVASWSALMATGIDVIPIQFANMDYGQTYQSILAPDKAYMDLSKSQIPANLPFPDGTYLAKYHIYKMLKMSKNYLVAAKNGSNAYIIASKDDSGIAIIISNHQNINQSVTVNLSNLQSNFQTGNNHFEQYLVDMTHSTFDWNPPYDPSKNKPLEKVDDSVISPISSFNKTFAMNKYSTIFIVITPESQPCSLPQFDFTTTQP